MSIITAETTTTIFKRETRSWLLRLHRLFTLVLVQFYSQHINTSAIAKRQWHDCIVANNDKCLSLALLWTKMKSAHTTIGSLEAYCSLVSMMQNTRYSGCYTSWPVKYLSRRLGASHLYDSKLFCRLTPLPCPRHHTYREQVRPPALLASWPAKKLRPL